MVLAGGQDFGREGTGRKAYASGPFRALRRCSSHADHGTKAPRQVRDARDPRGRQQRGRRRGRKPHPLGGVGRRRTPEDYSPCAEIHLHRIGFLLCIDSLLCIDCIRNTFVVWLQCIEHTSWSAAGITFEVSTVSEARQETL